MTLTPSSSSMTSSADPHRAYLMRALEILSDRERLVYDHMTSTREQSMTSGCTTDDNPVVPELMIRVIQSLRGVCIGINLDERSSINGDDPKAGVVDRELLTEAETYLETILTWRQAQGVVLASSENNPSSSAEMDSVVSRAWPSYLCGLDHEDHWVHFESLKDIDVQSLVHDLEPRDVIRCRIRLHEVLEHEKRARSMARKTCVYRHIYVLDLAGLKTAYFLPSVLAVLRPLFDIGQKYYPESLHRMYLVNAPWIFRGLWKIISPWIHPETRAKIQILSNAREFLKKSTEDGIPLESLPESLGGSCTGRNLDTSFRLSAIPSLVTTDTIDRSISLAPMNVPLSQS